MEAGRRQYPVQGHGAAQGVSVKTAEHTFARLEDPTWKTLQSQRPAGCLAHVSQSSMKFFQLLEQEKESPGWKIRVLDTRWPGRASQIDDRPAELFCTLQQPATRAQFPIQ